MLYINNTAVLHKCETIKLFRISRECFFTSSSSSRCNVTVDAELAWMEVEPRGETEHHGRSPRDSNRVTGFYVTGSDVRKAEQRTMALDKMGAGPRAKTLHAFGDEPATNWWMSLVQRETSPTPTPSIQRPIFHPRPPSSVNSPQHYRVG